MLFQIASDTHADKSKVGLADLEPHPDAEALLFAGDLCDGAHLMIPELAVRFAGVPVVMVDGNHDLWRVPGPNGFTIEEALDRTREVGARHGVTVLENESVILGEERVRVLGATLWTAFDLIPPSLTRREAMYVAQNGRLPDERGYGATRSRMNDYVEIHQIEPSGSRKRFTPSRSIAMHKQSRSWLESQLAVEHDGPTVILSHHPGSPQMLMDQSIQSYRPLDYCYASDLEEIMHADNAPDFWFSGHVHESRDLTIGNTRVLSNPRGYPMGFGQFENPGWNPQLVVDIVPRLQLTNGMGI